MTWPISAKRNFSLENFREERHGGERKVVVKRWQWDEGAPITHRFVVGVAVDGEGVTERKIVLSAGDKFGDKDGFNVVEVIGGTAATPFVSALDNTVAATTALGRMPVSGHVRADV
eukprot:scaffold1885_cov72-Skeletonema_dohrnii-CCMP3373.AAC.2